MSPRILMLGWNGRPSRLAGNVAFALLLGCTERRETPKPKVTEEPNVAPADAAPAVITVGHGHVLRHGKARLEDRHLSIRLTDQPGACGLALQATWTSVLTLEVPGGPGGRFFAGSPTGVRAFGIWDDSRAEISPAEAIVTLSPVELAKGALIKGHLELPRGGGAFEAEICALESSVAVLPSEVSDQPIGGTLDGKPFRVEKALIYLEGDTPEARRLDRLRLHQTRETTCTNVSGSTKPALVFTSIGGTGSRRPLTGSPQPAWAAAAFVGSNRAAALGRMPAWIRFERLAFEPGASVRGALVLEHAVKNAPTTRITGSFEAEVCSR